MAGRRTFRELLSAFRGVTAMIRSSAAISFAGRSERTQGSRLASKEDGETAGELGEHRSESGFVAAAFGLKDKRGPGIRLFVHSMLYNQFINHGAVGERPSASCRVSRCGGSLAASYAFL